MLKTGLSGFAQELIRVAREGPMCSWEWKSEKFGRELRP